jgi:uncharacterized integral membrane protein
MSVPPAHTTSSGDRRPPQPAKRDRRELARAIAAVVLAAIFIAFALLNLRQVHVDWILGSGHAPLIIVIAISLLVGIVLTYFTERLSRSRRSR